MSKLNGLKTKRAAALLLCGAMLAVLPAMAQQDQGPPPQDQGQGQMQGQSSGWHGHGRHGMDPHRRLEMMQQELNLTPDQVTQVKAIFADGHAKMEAMRSQDQTQEAQDNRAQMMSMMKDQNAKIRGLLTPDQQTKFDAMQARMHDRMQHHHRQQQDGDAPPPPQ